MTDWDEAKLGPLPDAVREYERSTDSLSGMTSGRSLADAAIEELANGLLNERADNEDLRSSLDALRDKWVNACKRAEQAEAEVACLNRVLKAGREEYELAIAEMNRRGDEVERLNGPLEAMQTKCERHGIWWEGKDYRDFSKFLADLAARFKEEHDG